MIIEKLTYFYPEKPALIIKESELFNQLDQSDKWVAEHKYNGSRLSLHQIDGRFEFWDRHGKHLAYNKNPSSEILNILNSSNLPRGYNVFDGELRHNKAPGIQHKIVIYDVLVYDGKLLINIPFRERRMLIERHFSVEFDPVGITKQFQTGFEDIYNVALKKPEFEGIVIKNKDGVINFNRSANPESDWMKKVRKKTGRHRW